MLSYYGFAFFIFFLLCILALICSYLFTRRRNNMQALNEKEKKLLALYSTLEDMMDEFNDTAKTAHAEISHRMDDFNASMQGALREMNRRAGEIRNVAVSLQQNSALPEMPLDLSPGPAYTLPDENIGPAVAGVETPSFMPLSPLETAVGDRSARILSLHKQGMDRVHIAKELAVTLSEVDLVLGLAAQKK